MSGLMMPSNPRDLKKINNALEEISMSTTRIEAERELIKDTVDAISDEFDIPKKLMRQLAKVYHARNYVEAVAQQEDFQTAFESLTTVNKTLELPEDY
jgi:rRNA processing protein Krr1/Pno1